MRTVRPTACRKKSSICICKKREYAQSRDIDAFAHNTDGNDPWVARPNKLLQFGIWVFLLCRNYDRRMTNDIR